MPAPEAPLLLHLPVVYAVALALRDAGLDSSAIACRLDLAVESMPALFEIADAKLGALRIQRDRDQSRRAETQ